MTSRSVIAVALLLCFNRQLNCAVITRPWSKCARAARSLIGATVLFTGPIAIHASSLSASAVIANDQLPIISKLVEIQHALQTYQSLDAGTSRTGLRSEPVSALRSTSRALMKFLSTSELQTFKTAYEKMIHSMEAFDRVS